MHKVTCNKYQNAKSTKHGKKTQEYSLVSLINNILTCSI